MAEADGLAATVLRELDEITVADRIRQATDLRVQERIDRQVLWRAGQYAHAPRSLLSARLAELEREWEVERVLVLQSSLTALAGLVLGGVRDRRWLWLSAVTSGFLLQHALQGWCPPLAWHRRLGFRTRREIDLEIQLLKQLRGDYAATDAPPAEATLNR